MGAKHVNPARIELTHLKREPTIAVRGRKLLKDKQDELMRQFLGLVRENKALREKVEAGIAAANQNFVLACSGMTDEALNVALMTPKQEVYLESEARNVMNVEIPVFRYKTRTSDPNDIYPYGSAFTSSDLDDVVRNLTDFLPGMPHLVEYERSCQLVAAEIEEARRHVNALEHVIIPETQQDIRYITMKLDENKRNSQTRLVKVKNMVLEEAHHYSEREVVPVVDEV